MYEHKQETYQMKWDNYLVQLFSIKSKDAVN